MMTTKIACSVVGLLVCLSVSGQSVEVKKIKTVDFPSLQTFTVAKGEMSIPKDERKYTDEEFYETIKKFIREELEFRGYTFTEDSLADFTVDYVAGSFRVNENEDLGPLGGTPINDPAGVDQSRYWSKSYQAGLLVIEIYHKGLAWSAESSLDLSLANGERTLAAMVAKSFRKFPKKKKK